MKTTRYFRLLLAAGGLLCVPLVAGQFTPEVDWSPADFAVMGFLLFVLVTVIEWIWRRTERRSFRYAGFAAAGVLFLLIWAELAVGIFGTPLAGR